MKPPPEERLCTVAMTRAECILVDLLLDDARKEHESLCVELVLDRNMEAAEDEAATVANYNALAERFHLAHCERDH